MELEKKIYQFWRRKVTWRRRTRQQEVLAKAFGGEI